MKQKNKLFTPNKSHQRICKANHSKGFTLIEVLVAIGISVVLLASAYELYFLANKTWIQSNVKYEVRQNARIALERMSRDIRQSDKIISSLPIDNTNPPSEIKFQDGHITNKIQYITYKLEETNIKKVYSHFSFSSSPETWVYWDTKDGTGQSPTETIDLGEIISENISSVTFWGVTAINVSLVSTIGTYQESYETIITARNIL